MHNHQPSNYTKNQAKNQAKNQPENPLNHAVSGLAIVVLMTGLLQGMTKPTWATPPIAAPTSTEINQGATNSTPTHRRSTAQQITPPPAPRTPAPRGSNIGGGSLGGVGCGTTQEKLIAIVPVNQYPLYTATEYPTLYFYVPYGAADVEYGEFSLFVGRGGLNRLYQTRFSLPQTPGFVSVKFPGAPDYALKTREDYHWYFKLYCKGNTERNADAWVDGWIQRSSGQNAETANSESHWYDTIATVMQQLQTAAVSSQARERLRQLLHQVDGDRNLIDWQTLADKPLAGEVKITP